MPDSRIDDLRRRVQTDPSSIAFAQLAEECRREGNFQEAIDVSSAGLTVHPEYTSARVTLARALIQVDRLDEAKLELERVLVAAPDSLAALRGLGYIHQQQGRVADALAQYRAALALAPNDPELEQTVARLSHDIDLRAGAGSSVSAGTDDRSRAALTIAALEDWIDAIHVARTHRGA